MRTARIPGPAHTLFTTLAAVTAGGLLAPGAIAQAFVPTSRTAAVFLDVTNATPYNDTATNLAGTHFDSLLAYDGSGFPLPCSTGTATLASTTTLRSDGLTMSMWGDATGGTNQNNCGVFASARTLDEWYFNVAAPTCFSLSVQITTAIGQGDAINSGIVRLFGPMQLTRGTMDNVLGINRTIGPNTALVETYSGTLMPGQYSVLLSGYSSTTTNPAHASHNATLTLVLGMCDPVCDPIDFNGDGLFPDTADIDDFLSVFSGGPCSTGACGDIDFNNDGLFPDTADIDALLRVFSGGTCA